MTGITTGFKLLHVVGTRPNFMKVASVMAAVERWNLRSAASGPRFVSSSDACLQQVLVHTGQHYDERMSLVFFSDLGLPQPDYYLGVGSGTHAQQTARIMLALEPIVLKERPDLVVVVGDVNSTVAAALVAAKLRVPVAHVEAGLRSGDRAMPEELNRLLTDQLSDLLFTTCADADANLAREGIPSERVFFVGNTMIDTLEAHLPRAVKSPILATLGLTRGRYAVATLHRPSNVDAEEGMELLLRALRRVSERLPIVFPVHARTRDSLRNMGLVESVEGRPGLILTDPLGYLDFLSLLAQSRLVLTDSGGIQEETTVLGVPCLTLRTSTERPVTIVEGTNQLVDPNDEDGIVVAVETVLATRMAVSRRPKLWDGHAGDRIVETTATWLQERQPVSTAS